MRFISEVHAKRQAREVQSEKMHCGSTCLNGEGTGFKPHIRRMYTSCGWRPKPEENPDLNRSPGDRRGAKRPGGSKGREV